MSLIISSSLIKMELLFGLFNANSASLSLLFSKSLFLTNTFVFLVMTAIFDDECTRLTFSFENRYNDIGLSGPVKSLMFRVQLKPFANVIFSQGEDQITF